MPDIQKIEHHLESEILQALSDCKQGLSLEAQVFVRNEVGNICGTNSGSEVASISQYQTHSANALHVTPEIEKQRDQVSKNIQKFLCNEMGMEMELIKLMNISHILFVTFINYVCVKRIACEKTGIYTSGNIFTYHQGGKKYRKQFGTKNTQADALGNLLTDLRAPKRNIDQIKTTSPEGAGTSPNSNTPDTADVLDATYESLMKKGIVELHEGAYRIAYLYIKDDYESPGKILSINTKRIKVRSSTSIQSFEKAFRTVVNGICVQKNLSRIEKKVLLDLSERSLYPDRSTSSTVARSNPQREIAVIETNMSTDRFAELNVQFTAALKEGSKQ